MFSLKGAGREPFGSIKDSFDQPQALNPWPFLSGMSGRHSSIHAYT